MVEIPICHQACVLSFENPVGQPPRSILSLRVDHDTQSSNHVQGNLESLSRTSHAGRGRWDVLQPTVDDQFEAGVL